ncbi:MAG: DUF1028 domain-containing protein [Burkholderiales bacterium]|nr:DUF1028 domain-containing protein [Burkholderiales bacterium]
MTFSIIARCTRTGAMGMAVASSSPAVAARCAWAQSGAGVVSTQNITDPTLGPRGLERLARGDSAETALRHLIDTGHAIEYRQLAVLDSEGGTATYSGRHTLGVHGSARAANVAAAGNLLSRPDIPDVMVAQFVAMPDACLGTRLLAAMAAALEAGGEAGPIHSAGMLVVEEVAWPVADLRIDWTDGDPITELTALWNRWQPQMRDYVTRALDPTAAPSYGVPGDPGKR